METNRCTNTTACKHKKSVFPALQPRLHFGSPVYSASSVFTHTGLTVYVGCLPGSALVLERLFTDSNWGREIGKKMWDGAKGLGVSVIWLWGPLHYLRWFFCVESLIDVTWMGIVSNENTNSRDPELSSILLIRRKKKHKGAWADNYVHINVFLRTHTHIYKHMHALTHPPHTHFRITYRTVIALRNARHLTL